MLHLWNRYQAADNRVENGAAKEILSVIAISQQ
jgi:hypothetical protein